MHPDPHPDADDGRDAMARWLRALPFTGLALALTLFFAAGGERYLAPGLLAASAEWLRNGAERLGWLAPVAVVLAIAIAAAIALPTRGAGALAAGLLFGPWAGAVIAITGETLGAGVLFAATAPAFRGVAERRAGPQGAATMAAFRRNGLLFTLALRLPPLLPIPLSVIMPAVLGARLKPFLIATALGSAPGALILAQAGAAVAFPVNATGFGLPIGGLDAGVLSGLGALALIVTIIASLRWQSQSTG